MNMTSEKLGLDVLFASYSLFVCKALQIKRNFVFLLIFRDAVNDLALHFLAKMKIMVVKDIEREDIEFVCKVSI